jgi:hypothetical protein
MLQFFAWSNEFWSCPHDFVQHRWGDPVFQKRSEDNPLLFFAGLAVLFLGIIFSIAVHQAESLLVDIADTLIEQNRRKANTPKENP